MPEPQRVLPFRGIATTYKQNTYRFQVYAAKGSALSRYCNMPSLLVKGQESNSRKGFCPFAVLQQISE